MESVKNISNSEWQPTIQKASIAGTVLSALGLMGIIWVKRRGGKLPKATLPVTATTGLLSIGGILISWKVDPVNDIEKFTGKKIKSDLIEEICKEIEKTSGEEDKKIELIQNLIAPAVTITKDSNGDVTVKVSLHYGQKFPEEENRPSILDAAATNLIEQQHKDLPNVYAIHIKFFEDQ